MLAGAPPTSGLLVVVIEASGESPRSSKLARSMPLGRCRCFCPIVYFVCMPIASVAWENWRHVDTAEIIRTRANTLMLCTRWRLVRRNLFMGTLPPPLDTSIIIYHRNKDRQPCQRVILCRKQARCLFYFAFLRTTRLLLTVASNR